MYHRIIFCALSVTGINVSMGNIEKEDAIGESCYLRMNVLKEKEKDSVGDESSNEDSVLYECPYHMFDKIF